jgi:protein subunit release factor A
VTVVALEVAPDDLRTLDLSEVKLTLTKGTGPGGQHRNKTESKVIATHLPTGISAAADSRSQHQNRETALAVLASRVAALSRSQSAESINADRRRQASDQEPRAFTWTEWRDSVTNHATGTKTKMSKALRGQLTSLA